MTLPLAQQIAAGLSLLAMFAVAMRGGSTRAGFWAILLGLGLGLSGLSLSLSAQGHERLLPVGFVVWAMLPALVLPLGIAVANIGLLRQLLLFFNACLSILAVGLVYWLFTLLEPVGGGLRLPPEARFLGAWGGTLVLAALFDASLVVLQTRRPEQRRRMLVWALLLLLLSAGWGLDLAVYLDRDVPAWGLPLLSLAYLGLAVMLWLRPGPRKISGTISPAIIQESKQAMLIADGDGRVQAVNAAAVNMLNRRRYQILGKDMSRVMGLDVEHLDTATRLHGAGYVERIRIEIKTVNAVREVAVQPVVLRSARGEVMAVICTLHPGAEDPALAATSLQDPVTGLPGAALGEALLEQELRRHSGGSGPLVAALFVRLDDVGAAARRHGQVLHDRLQNAVVERLNAVCDWPLDLARSAGGGYLLLLTQVNDREEVLGIAERARDLLSRPFKLDDKELDLPAYLAVLPDLRVYHELVDVLADARYGLQQARHDPARPFVVDQRASDRVTLALGLEAALATDALDLHLEPVVDIESQSVMGARASVSWQPEDMPPLHDAELRRLARRVHLEGPLNQWRIRQLAKAAVPKGWTIWLPVDVEDLQASNFVKAFPKAVTRLPFLLALELPDAAWLLPSVRKQAEELVEHGLGLHAQQFTVSGGMVTHSAGLRVRAITLDARLVQSHTPATDALVSGMVATAKVLGGARLRADGVRKPADLKRLLQLGVGLACGEYFTRPLGPAELAGWLQDEAVLKGKFAGMETLSMRGEERRRPTLS